MSFTSPLWLLALAPWLALAVWMLWGRRERVGVPFLDLWRGPVSGTPTRRALRTPPVAIMAVLLACLLALLAAAGPVARVGITGDAAPIILVDRGLTMSAGGRERPRFVELSWEVYESLVRELGLKTLGNVASNLRTLPARDDRRTDIWDWGGIVHDQVPPTAAAASAEEVEAIVARALAEGERPVVLLSDAGVRLKNPRLLTAAPPPLGDNVGITHLAVRETPRAQVMVRVRNESSQVRATLVVTGGARVSIELELPPRGQVRDYFIDLPRLTDTVEVAVTAANDVLAADDRAWLVREASEPRVEVRDAVPAEVSRVVEAYGKVRPAAGGASTVAVVGSAAALPDDAPAAVAASAANRPAAGEPVVVDHPVTQNVAWSRALRDARVAAAPDGWRPVVTAGGRAVVAVQEAPVRRAWVGVQSPALARSADFVVLWANVLDWLGGGGAERFVSHGVERLGEEWEPVTAQPTPRPEPGLWPGLYRRRSDGAMRAVNAPAPDLTSRSANASPEAWRADVARWAAAARDRAGTPLAPPLLLGATACLLLAAATWPRRAAPSSTSPTTRGRGATRAGDVRGASAAAGKP